MGNWCGKEGQEGADGSATSVPNPVSAKQPERGAPPAVDQMAVMRSVVHAIMIMQRVDSSHKVKTFYTSSYDLNGNNPQAVAISNSNDEEMPADYTGARDEDLSPSDEMLAKYHGREDDNESHAEYAADYLALLESRGLSPAKIADKYPDGTVFICYNYPEGDTSICHRYILSEILNTSMAAVVTEIGSSISSSGRAVKGMSSAVKLVVASNKWRAGATSSQGLKTFYTSTYQLSSHDPMAVAITNAEELKAKAPGFTGKVDTDLGPSTELLQRYYNRADDDQSHAEYTRDYLSELNAKGLTPAAIAEKFEDGTVFVCYDYDAADSSICHRHVLGEVLREAGVARVVAKCAQSPLGVMRDQVRMQLLVLQAFGHKTTNVQKKRFFTSTYDRSGDNEMAVSVTNSREMANIEYSGARAEELSPSDELLAKYYGRADDQDSHAEYTREYIKLLRERGLTPAQIADKYEEGTIFICYDYPPGDNSICHRQILAELLIASKVAIVSEM